MLEMPNVVMLSSLSLPRVAFHHDFLINEKKTAESLIKKFSLKKCHKIN